MAKGAEASIISLRQVALKNRFTIDNVDVAKGQCIHILGPNGAGKSSLLLVMAGLLEPDSGQVSLYERPMSSWSLATLAGVRTMLGQHSLSSFQLTVGEYLSFYSQPVIVKGSSAPHLCAQPIPPLIEKALEVKSFLPKVLTHLPGGERQRVEICRTLLQIWPLLEKGEGLVLLDEPLQGLDIRHQYALANLVNVLCKKGNTVVMSSHDISLSANYGNALWLMHKGELVVQGLPEEVATQHYLESVFECHFAISKHDNFLEIQVCAPISLE